MFSLVSGTYRQAKRFGSGVDTGTVPVEDGENPSAIVLRNQDSALSVLSDSAASECLVHLSTNGKTDGGLQATSCTHERTEAWSSGSDKMHLVYSSKAAVESRGGTRRTIVRQIRDTSERAVWFKYLDSDCMYP